MGCTAVYVAKVLEQWYACPRMFPIASRREHAPSLSPARVAWEFDEADTSLFWSLGIPSVPHPSVLVPGEQEVRMGSARRHLVGLSSTRADRGRITWMALLSTQRLLNCDVQDGASLSWNPQKP